MCNLVHPDSRAIPQKGFGYKLFSLSADRTLKPLTYAANYKSTNGWVVWDDVYAQFHIVGAVTDFVKAQMGFCFFMSIREAKKARRLWGNPCQLIRIEYNRGLGRHFEYGFCEEASIDMAICREFRIINTIT